MILGPPPKPHEHSFGDGVHLTAGSSMPHRYETHHCEGMPTCPMPDGTTLIRFLQPLIGTLLICDDCGEGFVVEADVAPGSHRRVVRQETRRERRRRLKASL